MSLTSKEHNLGNGASPLTGLSPGGVSTCQVNSPGRSIRRRDSASEERLLYGSPRRVLCVMANGNAVIR